MKEKGGVAGGGLWGDLREHLNGRSQKRIEVPSMNNCLVAWNSTYWRVVSEDC